MQESLRNIVICGAGGLGRELLSLIRRDYSEELKVIGFIDDNENLPDTVEGVPIYSQDFLDREKVSVVIGFANVQRKNRLLSNLETKPNLSFPNIISKHAIVNKDAKLGKGVVITDFCWISTRVVIEDGVFLNVATLIGHDTKIGRACSIMPQCAVSGFVKVGKETFIGAKSFILQGKVIGDNATISAGAIVCRDIRDGEVAISAQAKVLKARQ